MGNKPLGLLKNREDYTVRLWGESSSTNAKEGGLTDGPDRKSARGQSVLKHQKKQCEGGGRGPIRRNATAAIKRRVFDKTL